MVIDEMIKHLQVHLHNWEDVFVTIVKMITFSFYSVDNSYIL